MNTKRLFERIHALMAEQDFGSIRAVCVAAGVAPDFLRDIKVGRNRQPATEKMAKVAATLGTSIDDLLAAAGIDAQVPTGAPRRPEIAYCRVIGQAVAGTWREALEWEKDEQFEIPILKDERYPGIPRYGLQLGGDSMNRLYPLPNTIVICVRFLDIGRGPMPGEVVIAERQRHDLYEATCKVFAGDEAKAYLEPRSTNATHKPLRLVRTIREFKQMKGKRETFAFLKDHNPEIPRDTDIVDITGLVVGAFVQQ